MAFIAVVVSACLLISSTVHAIEPVFDVHTAEQGLAQSDHGEDGKSGAPHGCLAHCHGHSLASPPLAGELATPEAKDALWRFAPSSQPPGNPTAGLERPPRV